MMRFIAGLVIGAMTIVGGYVGGIMGDAFMVKAFLIFLAITTSLMAVLIVLTTRSRTRTEWPAQTDHPRIVIEGEVVDDAPQSQSRALRQRPQQAQVRRR